ncbi:SLAM family member 8 isoform X4 [Cyanistes caeruleus]|uniref:SLAM family member 8 isoform X1 n=1 Tax=Cyanistes caeruleus TaxID=156563 RepID=UPI000CDAC9F4|nr:SLAM family member 8 isoform X1 [Cyanistes caeruleus]XP_023797614.1 SLAM family member 8 isoform X2 [Cyanistes caeruleus]XP_023797616.1 SLAM family member 8 isoform X4 [Cyanistes caeruleus]
MAPGSTPSFFLLLVARAWAQEAAPLEATGAVGGAALLSPRGSQNPADYSQIHWRWENRVRIAIWKRGEQPEYPQSPFQGRLELLGNHALKLGHLRRGDGGRFQLYREDDAGKESVEEFLLKVYDLVPKPHVTATTTGDRGQCKVTLRCSVDLQGVTYEWIPPQRVLVEDGPVLNVSFNPEVETFTCKVSNAVSSNNASLTFRHPCSWTDGSSSLTCAMPSLGNLLLFLLLLFLLP